MESYLLLEITPYQNYDSIFSGVVDMNQHSEIISNIGI